LFDELRSTSSHYNGSDTTIVSGDSLGHTTMWSARFGTPLHRAAEHSADVL
jgi:hypothetical protein